MINPEDMLNMPSLIRDLDVFRREWLPLRQRQAAADQNFAPIPWPPKKEDAPLEGWRKVVPGELKRGDRVKALVSTIGGWKGTGVVAWADKDIVRLWPDGADPDHYVSWESGPMLFCPEDLLVDT